MFIQRAGIDNGERQEAPEAELVHKTECLSHHWLYKTPKIIHLQEPLLSALKNMVFIWTNGQMNL